MEYALIQVLPDIPAGQVCAGIDWATVDHVACVVDMAGRVKDRFAAAHDKAGIEVLIARLRRAGVSEVAIERGDGVLVGALLDAGLTVVVITSRQVKNLRSRYGAAGAKDDRFDSFVLADTLRLARLDATPLPGFDENQYMQTADFNSRPLAELLEEFTFVRRGHLLLLRHLPPAAWQWRGTVIDHPATCRSLAYVMAGHVEHHLAIVKKRLAG